MVLGGMLRNVSSNDVSGVPALRASSEDDPATLLGARQQRTMIYGEVPHAR